MFSSISGSGKFSHSSSRGSGPGNLLKLLGREFMSVQVLVVTCDILL